MPRTTAKEHVMQALLEIGENKLDSEKEQRKCFVIFVCRKIFGTSTRILFRGRKASLKSCTYYGKKPRLMLLDEPTASLDNESKIPVKEMLMKLKKREQV